MNRGAGPSGNAEATHPDRMVVFGMGRLGSALLQGWRAAGVSMPGWVAVDPAAPAADAPFRIVRNAAAAGAFGPFGTALIAVKPGDVPTVVRQARPLLSGQACLVSVAAGVSLAVLEEAGGQADVIRAMPNLAAAEGASVTFLCAGPRCRPEALERAVQLFAAVGSVHVLSHEDGLHVATAVGGSGPALVYRFLEALRDAAGRHGMDAGSAEQIVIGMASGALALARSGSSLAGLRDGVTSPRGTTAAALDFLGRDGLLDQLLLDAVAAAKARSRELGNPSASAPEYSVNSVLEGRKQ